MTRTIYFDCFAGISGDMIVGALVDLGLDPDDLRDELKKLPFAGYRLETLDVHKRGLRAKAFRVYLEGEEGEQLADAEFVETADALPEAEAHDRHHAGAPSRHLSEILDCIERSDLSERVRQQTSAIFTRLG